MPPTAPVTDPTRRPTGLTHTPPPRVEACHGSRPLPGPHRARALDRGVPVRGAATDLRVKIASGRDEFDQAFRLLADRYRARGYEAGDARPYRYTPHHALPGTVTFVALEGDRVAVTLSLVPDNPALGLPMESTYPEEVAALRRRGRRLGEVTSLADDGLAPRDFLRVFAALIRLVAQYHVRRGGDTWVIAINPRHRGYYERVHGFAPLGPRRAYAAVQDSPAEALVLELEALRRVVPDTYRALFGEPLPGRVLTPVAWPADFAADFGANPGPGSRRGVR